MLSFPGNVRVYVGSALLTAACSGDSSESGGAAADATGGTRTDTTAVASTAPDMTGYGDEDGSGGGESSAGDSGSEGGGSSSSDSGGGEEEVPIANPVLRNCADPGALAADGRFYLTCTGGSDGNAFPIHRSDDLRSFTSVGHVFPAGTTPAWAEGHYWAPELHVVPGGYAAYFSALSAGRHVLGVASSPTVEGPYTDSGAPLLADAVSFIDVHAFTDLSGERYLYYKREGQPDALFVRRLQEDGLAVTADAAVQVLATDRAWEGDVVEAPWVERVGDSYFLFYSGAAYCNASYAIGVARASSPLGPFSKYDGRVVGSSDRWVGPGHNSVIAGPNGEPYLVYHAYALAEGTPACGDVEDDNDSRHTLVDRLDLTGEWPAVHSRDVAADGDAVMAVQVNIFKGGRFDTLDTGGPVTYGTARRFAQLVAQSWAPTAVVGMQEISDADNAEMLRQILEQETGGPWQVRFFDNGTYEGALPAFERSAIFWRTDVLEQRDDFGTRQVELIDTSEGFSTRSLRFGGLLLRRSGSERDLAVFTGKLAPLSHKRDGVVLDNDDRAKEAEVLMAWIDEKLAPYPDATRLIAVDTNADHGTPAWEMFRQQYWDGDDDRPTHFTYSDRRIDFLFWDMDAGALRRDGILVGPLLSGDFGSDHLAVAARLFVRE